MCAMGAKPGPIILITESVKWYAWSESEFFY